MQGGHTQRLAPQGVAIARRRHNSTATDYVDGSELRTFNHFYQILDMDGLKNSHQLWTLDCQEYHCED